MEQYEVTHACGHTLTYDVDGSKSWVEEMAAWRAKQPCPECRKAAAAATVTHKCGHTHTYTYQLYDLSPAKRAEKIASLEKQDCPECVKLAANRTYEFKIDVINDEGEVIHTETGRFKTALDAADHAQTLDVAKKLIYEAYHKKEGHAKINVKQVDGSWSYNLEMVPSDRWGYGWVKEHWRKPLNPHPRG